MEEEPTSNNIGHNDDDDDRATAAEAENHHIIETSNNEATGGSEAKDTGSNGGGGNNNGSDDDKRIEDHHREEVDRLIEEQIEKIVTERGAINGDCDDVDGGRGGGSGEELDAITRRGGHQGASNGSPDGSRSNGVDNENNDSVISDVIEEIINTQPSTSGRGDIFYDGPAGVVSVMADSQHDDDMTNNQIVVPNSINGTDDQGEGIIAVIPKSSQETGAETQKEYVVEKILDKKIDSRGFAKYLVKWEGYPSSQNSWEPLEHLVDCEKMMQQYELSRAAKLATRMVDESGQVRRNLEVKKISNPKHKRYTIDEVLGMTEAKGQRYFLISLANTTHKAFIRASLANKLFPNKVIDYYIRNLRWKQKPPPPPPTTTTTTTTAPTST